jgi:hypothetical protein
MSDQTRLTELRMSRQGNRLLAEAILRNANGEKEEGAEFLLPQSVTTELKTFSLTAVGLGDASSATFSNLRADISHKSLPEITDLLVRGVPAPDTEPPFLCPTFTSFEGSNSSQTLSLNNGNQVNLVTDLTPWI